MRLAKLEEQDCIRSSSNDKTNDNFPDGWFDKSLVEHNIIEDSGGELSACYSEVQFPTHQSFEQTVAFVSALWPPCLLNKVLISIFESSVNKLLSRTRSINFCLVNR